MRTNNFCPYCETEGLTEVKYNEVVTQGRRKIQIEGLLKNFCENCGESSIEMHQHDHNLLTTQEQMNRIQGGVVSGDLRSLREKWNLTQRDASRVFGAGASSFAKWESGQSNLSGPSALLIQCASRFPQVMAYLCDLGGVEARAESTASHKNLYCISGSFEYSKSVEMPIGGAATHPTETKKLPRQARRVLLDDSKSGNWENMNHEDLRMRA